MSRFSFSPRFARLVSFLTLSLSKSTKKLKRIEELRHSFFFCRYFLFVAAVAAVCLFVLGGGWGLEGEVHQY